MDNVIEVNPVILRPKCIQDGRKQDCFRCGLAKRNLCISPLGLCIRYYHNHKKGCPAYNKKKGCPPNTRIYDDVYDLSLPVFAIYNIFDFKAHREKMRKKHPTWTERQVRNLLYWQPKARSQLLLRIREFYRWYYRKGFRVETCPEGMGVNVTRTMVNVGIELEWPPETVAYQITLAAIPKEISNVGRVND